MDDTFETLEDDDLEEEAGEAVEAILFEVTKGESHGMFQACCITGIVSERCVHGN